MLHISCNIGTRDLPDMYALIISPRALGIHIRQITHAYVTTITYDMYALRLWAYISGKSLVPMLQLLHI